MAEKITRKELLILQCLKRIYSLASHAGKVTRFIISGFFITIMSVFFVIDLSAINAAAEQPGLEVVWHWQEAHYEVYNPTFSQHNEEIVFVRKFHVPDGHEAEMIPEQKLANFKKRLETDKRFEDPEIVVVRIGENRIEKLDWGWSPSFSPDGVYVTYAHQKKPISGFRVLARTLQGNEIRIYNRKTRVASTLAVPDTGYLSDPVFFPDGSRILYSLSDAVNGGFGGNIGVACVKVKSKESKVLYPPTKKHGLYELVDSKQFMAGKVMVIRQRPDGPGTFLANSYTSELLQLGSPPRVVYSWGSHDLVDKKPGFSIDTNRKLLIYDNGWRTLTDKSSISQTNRSDEDDEPGFISPDGNYIAQKKTNLVTISGRKVGAATYSWKAGGEVQDLSWSPDSKRIAVVVTKYEKGDYFLYDQLVVLHPKL